MIHELKAVAIFVEVVRAGSFRGSARQLGMSPAAISYNVAQLEKRLGNALIYRSTRKLSLTSEGEHLYRHASERLSEIFASLDEVAGQSSRLHGSLVVSATTALLHSSLNKNIARFCKKYPDIEFEIHYTDEREDPIGGGIDVMLRAGDMPDSSLKSRLVSRIRRKLVCSKAYYKTVDAPRKPEDLKNWKWIRLTMMPQERVLKRKHASISVTGTVSQVSVNSVDAMVQLCSQGMGLATPPEFLVEKLLKRGSLVEVLPEWEVASIPVYAVWPGNHVKNRNAHKFIEFVTEGT